MAAIDGPTDDNANALNAQIESTPLAGAEAIVRENFGIVGRATVLSSERDETFLIHTEDQGDYVLKIANPAESFDVLSFQTAAIMHLASKRLPIPLPRAVAAGTGEMVLPLSIGGTRRLTRLLTFLDGEQLYRTQPSLAQMRALGAALALLGKGLADFAPKVPQQSLLWDICNAAALREFVSRVEPSRQAAVTLALDGFDRLAGRTMDELPRQIIHNDFNPHNILVSPSDPDDVTGVIDFGDMVEAPLVNDLAVALSYQVGGAFGLDGAVAMLGAYHHVRPLGSLEIAALPTLLRTRLAMTVIITEWRAGLYPENRDYILRNHPVALAGLTRLADLDDAGLANFFRQKIGDIA
jgi:Ser/Thr protein kinase RdoA (MazF antagonist)